MNYPGLSNLRLPVLGFLITVLIVTGCQTAATPAPGSGTTKAPESPAAKSQTGATSSPAAAQSPVGAASPAVQPAVVAKAASPSPQASPASSLRGNLVIYSARKEELMQPVVDAFKKRYPDVNVTVKSGAPGELALLIQQERGSPGGDVFFTTDAAGLEALRQDGLLDPYRSPNAASVPDEFKAPDSAWTGVIGRSRNFMINTQLLRPEEAPQSVFDLTDPKWKDKLAIASIREGGVRIWLASLILERGEEATKAYVDGLKANNIKVLANHTEVANAVTRGEVPVGLLNHYYYVPKAREGAPVALIYPDQGPNQIGTLVTPLAVGILKGAKNPEPARAFVDFVLSPEGQAPLTTQEQEFPLLPGVGLGAAAAPGVRPIDQIKRPQIDFPRLAQAEKRAVELFTPQFSG